MLEKVEYTAAQKTVLDSEDKGLLVSASAGSGKTATIIEKIFRLIKSGEDINKMLIITFTDSASTEMKLRLKEELAKGVAENPKLTAEYDKLSTASITTLHGYCSKVIRQHFYALDLKPNFAVLDEENSRFLKTKALEKVLRDYSKGQDENFGFLSQAFGGRNYDELKKNILKFHSCLSSLEDKNDFLQNICTRCYETNLKGNPACDEANKSLVYDLSNLVDVLKQEKTKAEQEGALKFVSFFEQIIANIKKINSADFVENCKSLSLFSLPVILRGKLEIEDASFKDDFKQVWEDIKDELKRIKNVYRWADEKEIVSGLVIAKSLLQKFVEIESAFDREYTALKAKRNALDFDDLEKHLLKFLSMPDAKESLDFKYIFVDEYQDINPVQEKIILSLRGKNCTLIMVGDVKQSIYKFRNSTPEIFVEKSKIYGKKNSDEKLVMLNENFRSDGTILKFVNNIFDKCMGSDFGGVDYKKNSKLVPKSNYEKVSDVPKVEVCVFDTEKSKNEEYVYDDVYSVFGDKNEYKSKVTPVMREASVILSKIDEIVGKKLIYDVKTKSSRLATYKDIAILSRKNDYLNEIASILFEKRIPLSTNISRDIYEDQDTNRLVCLLKIINNAHDDESLAVVLSSLFDFSFDDLAKIRASFLDEKFFYNSVKKYPKSDSADKEVADKLNVFWLKINEYRNEFIYKTIGKFLDDFCEQNYYSYVLSLPNGRNRIKMVKDYVASFSGKYYNNSLSAYLEFIKNNTENSPDKIAVSGGENSVKLSTIHASKGLEYPIVFVVGTGRELAHRDRKTDILFNRSLGVSFGSFDVENHFETTNVAKLAISNAIRQGDMAEELRLLYVALTRAKNHLFITGCANLSILKHITTLQESKRAKSYLEWILSSLTDLSFKGLVENKKNVAQTIDGEKINFVLMQDEVLERSNLQTLSLPNCDEPNGDFLMFKNIPLPEEKIALKNSVSSLLLEHSESPASFNFAPKRLSIFEGEARDIKATTLGTIYHKIMEMVDFNGDFSSQVYEKIIEKIEVPDEYKKYITYSKISRCVEAIKSLGGDKFAKELPFISYMPYSSLFDDKNDNKVIVQGVADLLVCGENKHYLVDYKTTRIESVDQLVEKYKVQLMLYKKSLEKALNITIDETFVYSFVLEKLVKVF